MDLAVRLPNWVGDVCFSLPALDGLRRAGARLTCFGRSWSPRLLAALPLDCHALSRDLRTGARTLRRHAPRRIVLFPASFSAAAMARWAGLLPYGIAGDGRSLLLHRRLPTPPDWHEADRFWHLARSASAPLGLEPSALAGPRPAPRLPLPPAAVAAAAAILETCPRPLVVLSPLATGTVAGRDKRWPGFPELERRLHKTGVAVLCCPGPGEEERCRRLLPEARHRCDVDLPTLGALCAGADAVVANDSGPLHLAAAVGARVLGVFGVSDPRRYRPLGGAHLGGARGWPEPAAVAERVLAMLAGNGAPSSAVESPIRPA